MQEKKGEKIYIVSDLKFSKEPQIRAQAIRRDGNYVVYAEAERCPFCGAYTVKHMIPVGRGPTRFCETCHALWSPLLQIKEERGKEGLDENHN